MDLNAKGKGSSPCTLWRLWIIDRVTKGRLQGWEKSDLLDRYKAAAGAAISAFHFAQVFQTSPTLTISRVEWREHFAFAASLDP